jgi:hypothetical protein
MSNQTFPNAVKELNIKQKELMELAKTELKPYLQSLCTDKVTSFRFTAYTPYFNDGDPCRFSINEIYGKWAGLEEDAGDYEDGYDTYPEDADIKKDFEAISSAVYENSKFIEKVLGDGIQVTVTKDSVDVDRYDHD